MPKFEFHFIDQGPRYKDKRDYLQHIQELIQIEINHGDTFGDLLSKASEFGATCVAEKQKAVEDWIALNREGRKDDFFTQVINNSEEKHYARFDLRVL